MMEAMEPSFRKNILNSPRILEGPWILIKKILCIFWLLPTCLLKSSTIFKTSFAIYVVVLPILPKPPELARRTRLPAGESPRRPGRRWGGGRLWAAGPQTWAPPQDLSAALCSRTFWRVGPLAVI